MKIEWKRIVLPAVAAFYAVLWIGGVASYLLWGAPPPETAWAAPAFLWTAAALVLLAVPPGERRRLAACALLGFLIEVAGVHTGFPFGGYAYSDVLYPLVLGTPVVMGAAWLILLAYVRHMGAPWLPGRLAGAGAGALWMVAIDLLLDPLAAGPLGYWAWNHPHGYHGVPWSNFLGWWLASFLLLLVYPAPRAPSKTVTRTGLAVILFFAVLALAFRLWLPLLAGLSLCAADLWIRKRILRQAPARRLAPARRPASGSTTADPRPLRRR